MMATRGRETSTHHKFMLSGWINIFWCQEHVLVNCLETAVYSGLTNHWLISTLCLFRNVDKGELAGNLSLDSSDPKVWIVTFNCDSAEVDNTCFSLVKNKRNPNWLLECERLLIRLYGKALLELKTERRYCLLASTETPQMHGSRVWRIFWLKHISSFDHTPDWQEDTFVTFRHLLLLILCYLFPNCGKIEGWFGTR